MTEETKKKLLFHIRNRACIAAPMFSVQKVMECCDAEPWAKKCMDKIADDLLVDGKHVMIDFLSIPLDILIDSEGLVKCEAVFKKYISGKKYDEVERYAKCLTEHASSESEMLETIRGYSRNDLKKRVKDTRKDEELQQVHELLAAELASRRWWWKMHLVAAEWISEKRMYLKNYKLLQLIKRSLSQIKAEGNKSCEASAQILPARGTPRKSRKEIMDAAYWRFIKTHGAPEYLAGDTLKKYIYLSVNYFAWKRWTGRPLSGDTCEIRYFLIKPAMEAIGRLTPVELQQMFPITKEYDGEKWGSKDYFYTMNSLNMLNVDKPIGDEMQVGVLLWDYQNHALNWFLCQWMSCINDLYIYAKKREKHEKFHEALENHYKAEG